MALMLFQMVRMGNLQALFVLFSSLNLQVTKQSFHLRPVTGFNDYEPFEHQNSHCKIVLVPMEYYFLNILC